MKLEEQLNPRSNRASTNGNGQHAAPPRRQTKSANQLDVIDADDPRKNARLILAECFSHDNYPTLVSVDGEFNQWIASEGRYLKAEDLEIKEAMYRWYESKKKSVTIGDSVKTVDVKPKRSLIVNTLDALEAMVFHDVESPAWLKDASKRPAPKDLIVASNGVFRIDDEDGLVRVSDQTPTLFSVNALDYPIDLNAPEPTQFLSFLHELWPDDEESIQTLREWFGYSLLPWTALQKVLMLVGPKRSGKGTLARVLRRLIGEANTCGPTLGGMASNFGLWSFIGKTLATISDARLSGRSDLAIIAERLLSIIGEDALTIDRKNLPPVTMQLLTRIVLLTNELPRFDDASGALANRFVILQLHQSFLGREDHELTERLLTELPGILLWAVGGLMTLRQRGRFEPPASSAEALAELEDLASPIGAFVRDWCRTGPNCSVLCKDIYEAFVIWAKEQGNHHPGTIQVFGRDLRATLSRTKVVQSREGGDRVRKFSGVMLTATAEYSLSVERAKANSSEREAEYA